MRFLAIWVLATLSLYAADPPNPQAVQRGAKAFKASCGFCHGDDATGSRAPDLVRSVSLGHDVNGEVLAPIIREGRADKGMPGFALGKDQMADIVAFLHAQLIGALNSNRVPKDYPIERLLTGNAAAGKAYFNGAGECSSCHSPAGDLAGIARKFTPIDLQSRFLYPAGAPAKATVITPAGEKFEGALVHIDEFDVAIRDAAGWYRSWPRDRVKVEVHDPLEAHRSLLRKYTDSDVHNIFAYLETLQ